MALITCPECGKDVSSTAKACPHCGCPITQKEAIDNKMVNHEPATSDNNSTHVWALIGVAVLAIFIIIVVSLSDSSSSYDSRSSYSYEEERQSEEYEQYQQAYSEASQLASEADAARDKYLLELGNLSHKIYQREYQGILQQRLFWDCDDAFNDYKNKAEKLMRFLKSKGYSDEAQSVQAQIRQAEDAYRDLKRSVEGY